MYTFNRLHILRIAGNRLGSIEGKVIINACNCQRSELKMVAITIIKWWYSQLSKVLARALNRLVSADLRQELLISIQVSIIPRKTGLNYQQIVDILVSTLKVISNIKVTDMFVTTKYIPAITNI